jgi:hypothetical protein
LGRGEGEDWDDGEDQTLKLKIFCRDLTLLSPKINAIETRFKKGHNGIMCAIRLGKSGKIQT